MKRTGVILAVFLSVTPVASLNSQTVKTEPSIVQWNGTYGGSARSYVDFSSSCYVCARIPFGVTGTSAETRGG
jgi:hypothetical protein